MTIILFKQMIPFSTRTYMLSQKESPPKIQALEYHFRPSEEGAWLRLLRINLIKLVGLPKRMLPSYFLLKSKKTKAIRNVKLWIAISNLPSSSVTLLYQRTKTNSSYQMFPQPKTGKCTTITWTKA